MSFNFCILASGSSGNCAVVWTEKAVILIDCGCSARYILENLHSLNFSPKDINAVVITHAHCDHIASSAMNFLIEKNIPIYIDDDVYCDILPKHKGKIKECKTRNISDFFKIKDIEICAFKLFHKDNSINRCFGFTFSSAVNQKKYKIGYITDTGKITSSIAEKLANSNILAIEANYDEKLLSESFRPEKNKEWILSTYGHLSNKSCAKAIIEISKLSTTTDSLKYIFLSHLSRHHNNENLAIRTVSEILFKEKITPSKILAAKRNKKMPAIKITQ
ncbi:MAG: MBL fold metallo-hydrolase [Elusimicrobiota bacterium]|nr:MBL fold metallo-hydrolase [Elusimicrobiota bacterium]